MDPGQLQALIFDFDGVLVESVDIKTRAFAELYSPYGEETAAAVMEYHLANAGKSRLLKFRYAQEQLLRRPPLTEAQESWLDRRFSELVLEEVVKAPFVAGAESFLHRHCTTTPLFVASGTPEQELDRIILRRGMGHYFTAVFGSPATKQEIIARILGQYGFNPARVIMVGDAMSDYEGAWSNRVRFIGRVPAGETGPFPSRVTTVPDLIGLEHAIAAL